MDSASRLPHIAVFPFMAKGHTVPLIHLAHFIHRRRLATLTFFATPLNSPFLRRSLSGTNASVIELASPQTSIPSSLPPNIDSTDKVNSTSQFTSFVEAVSHLRPHFENALASLLPVTFLISDGFLTWTADSARKFGIPRMAFYGIGNFSWTMMNVVDRDMLHACLARQHSFAVPCFPNIRLTEHDLSWSLSGEDPEDPFYNFMSESKRSTKESYGVIVNSFYELEAKFFDYWNECVGPKAWCIGPLCLAKAAVLNSENNECSSSAKQWLDAKLVANRPVVYVAFGTQAQVSEMQLQEIAVGLDMSKLDFLWVVRAKEADFGGGFESRVGDRGMVVRGWVDQNEILQHESVRGFVSHCGWNSTLEAICAGVPILAWPLVAEQHLNANFVVDELRIGIRARASDGTRDGVVNGEDLARMVTELFAGERGKEAAENVKALAEAAAKAVEIGGSSWEMLESMIDEVSKK